MISGRNATTRIWPRAEQNSSNTETMEFRVSVCLSRFYNDERSYSYVYLDKKYDTVGSFETYLRRQFRLKDKFCLMSNNHLLPSSQTTKIIQPGDLIIVVPVKKDIWSEHDPELPLVLDNGTPEHADAVDGTVAEKANKKKNKKKKQKPETTESINSNDEEFVPVKKEKPNSIELVINNTLKRETDMEVSIGSEGDNEQREDIDQYNGSTDENTNEGEQSNQKVSDMQSVLNQLKLKALSMLPEVATQKPVAGVSGGRINKRKRIRKRNKNSTLSVSTPDLSDSTASPPLSFKPVKKSASHIRFDADTSQSANSTVKTPAITIKPRIVHAIDPNPGSNLSSQRSSISDVSTVELIISNTKTNAGFNEKLQLQPEPTKSHPLKVDAFRKRLAEFPVMDDVYPVPKDLILFKMLKIGDNYCPTVSDFILATVLEVDKLKGAVKVSIVDGREECIPVKGKFDIDKNSEDDVTDKMIIDIMWNQVSEPRLVFP